MVKHSLTRNVAASTADCANNKATSSRFELCSSRVFCHVPMCIVSDGSRRTTPVNSESRAPRCNEAEAHQLWPSTRFLLHRNYDVTVDGRRSTTVCNNWPKLNMGLAPRMSESGKDEAWLRTRVAEVGGLQLHASKDSSIIYRYIENRCYLPSLYWRTWLNKSSFWIISEILWCLYLINILIFSLKKSYPTSYIIRIPR